MPININKKGANVFVLSCIDPRFTRILADHLIHQGIKDDYDYFTLAGASLGANQTKFKGWKKTLTNTIDLAVKLHKIDEFWVFDHMDCGMYKAMYKIKKDDDPNIHYDEINELHNYIREKYPNLDFRGFIINKQGQIHQVV